MPPGTGQLSTYTESLYGPDAGLLLPVQFGIEGIRLPVLPTAPATDAADGPIASGQLVQRAPADVAAVAMVEATEVEWLRPQRP